MGKYGCESTRGNGSSKGGKSGKVLLNREERVPLSEPRRLAPRKGAAGTTCQQKSSV